jgi:hypothetical protein
MLCVAAMLCMLSVEIEMQAFTILTGPWCPMERVISSGSDFFSAPDGTLRAVVCHMHLCARMLAAMARPSG